MKPRGVPSLTVSYLCPTCHIGTWLVSVDYDGEIMDELSGCPHRSCWEASANGEHDEAVGDAVASLLDVQRTDDSASLTC